MAPADLEDGLGDLDAARAGVGAVEDRPAAPHAVLVGEDLQPLVAALVARVEDEPMGVDDGRRSDVPGLGPERGARGRARGAQDALRGVVVALALRRRLDALPFGRRRVVDEERLDALELVEEPVHVDDQVLDDRQPGQRRDGDPPPAELLDAQLAGQPVAPVDEHRVRAAHAVGARAPEGQRPVLLVLDPVEQVQDAVHLRVALDLVGLPVRLLVALGVEAEDAQIDLHQYVLGFGSNW